MGGLSSFSKNPPGDQLPKPIRTNLGSMYLSDLNSYKKACAKDPDLESFDSALYQRTNQIINSLAAGVDQDQPLSFGSLIEITGSLLDLNQEVVRFIIESKEDVWNNKDLSSLVNVYFESSIKILEFCNAVDICVRRAKISQMIMRFAVKQFEKETEMESETGVAEKTYVKTLEELKKFKAAGDPFKDDFFNLYESVYEQQISLLEQLHNQKRKIDKKMKKVRNWRVLSNVVFVTAFVSVLILSVVAAAVAMPPVVAAVAGALASPIDLMGKWCSYSWKKYEKALKGQRNIVVSMTIGTTAAKTGMENINVLVDKLRIKIESMLQTADFAVEKQDEVAVRLAIREINEELYVFMEDIEDIGQHAARCSRNIMLARTIVLEHIMRYPPSSSTEE